MVPTPGRAARTPWLLAFVLAAVLAAPARAAEELSPATRVVSMNPSLTGILLALGAGAALVGVEEHSRRLHPEVGSLPIVGGLFNPSVEAVVALEPDLVVLVPSAQQRDFQGRLRSLGIEVLELPNITLEEQLASIETLGRRVGRAEVARERVAAIRGAIEAATRATSALPRLRTVVVIQRDPLFVVGRGSYLDDLLRAAGAENAGAEFAEPYPRAGVEWLVAAAPQVLLDATGASPDPAAFWSRWPSIPAVRDRRAIAVPGKWVTLPDAHLDRALWNLTEILHGPDVARRAP